VESFFSHSISLEGEAKNEENTNQLPVIEEYEKGSEFTFEVKSNVLDLKGKKEETLEDTINYPNDHYNIDIAKEKNKLYHNDHSEVPDEDLFERESPFIYNKQDDYNDSFKLTKTTTNTTTVTQNPDEKITDTYIITDFEKHNLGETVSAHEEKKTHEVIKTNNKEEESKSLEAEVKAQSIPEEKKRAPKGGRKKNS